MSKRPSMAPTLITAPNLDELWFQVLYQLFHNEHGIHYYMIDDGSYAGDTRLEFDMAVLHVTDPGAHPMVPMVPPGLTPPADLDQIKTVYFPQYLMSDEKTAKEDYTYGERLVNPKYPASRAVDGWNYTQPNNNVNQLDAVIEKFKKGGHNTNQCTTEIAMPGDIILADPPCLRMIDWRIQSGALHMVVYFRSWDATFGLPANLAGLELLKQYMAGEIGVENGEMVAMSKGLHCYGQYYSYVGPRLNLDPDEVEAKVAKYKKLAINR